MMFSSLFTSSMSFLRRSSNSPRYLVPATSKPISSVIIRLESRVSGTSLAAIFCARPSAMADLPTPGSPIKHGLFLVRRPRICVTRTISFARPMHGSSLPSSAFLVRSLPNSSKVGFLRLTNHANHLRTNLCRVGVEVFEHARSHALAFTEQTEQQVFGADVVVAQLARLLERELQHALRARRERNLHRDETGTASNNLLNLDARFLQRNAHRLEHLGH